MDKSYSKFIDKLNQTQENGSVLEGCLEFVDQRRLKRTRKKRPQSMMQQRRNKIKLKEDIAALNLSSVLEDGPINLSLQVTEKHQRPNLSFPIDLSGIITAQKEKGLASSLRSSKIDDDIGCDELNDFV